MKKFYYLLASFAIVLVTMIACEKDSIGIEETQAVQDEEVLLAREMTKSDICHWDADAGVFFIINIADAAYDKHIAHGDKKPETYYEDLDGDGFGNPAVSVAGVCEAPSGYVDNSDDCDDTKLPFSPVGDFVAISSGYSQWDMSITDFDGTNFVGTAGFPAGASTYTFDVALTGTVVNGVFHGEIAFGAPGAHDLEGTVSECDGVDHLDWKWALIVDVADNDGDGYYDKYDCDDTDADINKGIDADGDGINSCDDCDDNKLPYSPEGEYTIYKNNGAWYHFNLDSYDSNTNTYSGIGEGRNTSNVIYSNLQVTAVVTTAPDMSLTIEVWVNGEPGVEKELSGTVSECNGITAITTADYSLSPFDGVNYLPIP